MTQENPKQKLWKSLNEKGLYTKDFNEFENQFSTPEKINKLYSKLNEGGLYSKSAEEFNNKFFSSTLGKQPEVTQGSQLTSKTSGEQQNLSSEPSSLVNSSVGTNTENNASNALESSQNKPDNTTDLINQRTVRDFSNLVAPEGTRIVEGNTNEYGMPVYANLNESGEYTEGGSFLPEVELKANRQQALDHNKQVEAQQLTEWESMKNSFKNIGNQLAGFDERLNIVTTDAYKKILGHDLAKTIYSALDTEGRDIDQVRADAYNELNRLKNEALPTLGFTDGNIAAGLVNASTSLFASVITALPTAGGGMASEMIGGMLYDFNSEKAKTKGVSVDDLYKNGDEDFWTPAAVGSFATALELIGLKGIGNAMAKQFTGSAAKRLALIFFEINKEGATEWLQTGLEKYSEALAQGKSQLEAAEEMAYALGSKEGLESYLQGLGGSASATAIGRGTQGVIDKVKSKKIKENQESLNTIISDIGNTSDPAIEEALVNGATNIIEETVKLKAENVTDIESLPVSTKANVMRLSDEKASLESSLTENGSSLSEEGVKQVENRIKEIETEVDSLMKESAEKTAVPDFYNGLINSLRNNQPTNLSNLEKGLDFLDQRFIEGNYTTEEYEQLRNDYDLIDAKITALNELEAEKVANPTIEEETPSEERLQATIEARQRSREEVDAFVEKFQQENPNTSVEMFDDLPNKVVRTFDRLEANLPVDPVVVKETSDYLYNKYKQIVAMKDDESRILTISQIEGIQEQLEKDIELLENYTNEQQQSATAAIETEIQPEATVDNIAREQVESTIEPVENTEINEVNPEVTVEPVPLESTPAQELVVTEPEVISEETTEPNEMPDREQTNPKLKRLIKSLPRQDIYSLMGPANVEYRRDVLEAITGKRPSKNDAGIRNVNKALEDYFGLTGSDAAKAVKLKNWANYDQTEFNDPRESDLYTLRNTEDVNQVLDIYETASQDYDHKEGGIAEYLGNSKINVRDFTRYGDANLLKGDRNLQRWIDSKNSRSVSLEKMAEELSEKLGQEIEPNDFIEYIKKYKNLDDFRESNKSDVAIEAEVRYNQLTGRNITGTALDKRRNQRLEQRSNETRERENRDNMAEIGITEQEVVDRQVMESEKDKATVNESKRTGSKTPKSLLEGLVDRLKQTGLANSVKLMTSEEIEADLQTRGDIRQNTSFQKEATESSEIESKAKADGAWMKAPNGKPSNLNEQQWASVRTQAFKDWFGDWQNDPTNASKVVDENGEPMVVYHGTNGNFTTFDPSKIGVNANAEGPGFYFTNDKSTAEGYQNTNKDNPNLFEVFLNIKNPINLNEPNFKKLEIKKIIKSVIENEIAFDPDGTPDFRDSFMSNFVDTYSLNETRAINEVADILMDNDTKIDFIAGLGNAVGSQSLVLKAVKESLGYDGTVANGYGNRGEGGGSIFISWESNQIKSATDNVGTYDSENNDIRHQKGSSVNGYVDQDGNIVINQDTAGIDTPIHEFGHVWLDMTKQGKVEVYNKGMELIQSDAGKPYVDFVRQTQPNLEGQALYEEALVQAIGDSGARLVDDQQRSKITEWLKALWDYIATRTGISDMTSDRISNMTLGEFTEAAAVDLLSGKKFAKAPNGVTALKVEARKAGVKEIKSEKDLTEGQKFMSDFMQRMKAKNGLSFQGSIDEGLSDQDFVDLMKFYRYAMEEGTVNNLTEAKAIADAMGITNVNEVMVAYNLAKNKTKETTGYKKSEITPELLHDLAFEKLSDEEVVNLGKQLVDDGTIDPAALVIDVLDKNRALQPIELTALQYYGSQMHQESIYLYDLIEEGGDNLNSYSVTIGGVTNYGRKAIDIRLSALTEARMLLEASMEPTGRLNSQALRLRINIYDKGFNAVKVISEMERLGYVSPELKAKIESLAKELQEVNDKLSIQEQKAVKRKKEIEISNITNEAKDTPKTTPKKKLVENPFKKKRSGMTARERVQAVADVVDNFDVNDFGLPGVTFQMNGELRFQVTPNNAIGQVVLNVITKMKESVASGQIGVSDALEIAINEINQEVGQGKWDEMKFRSKMMQDLTDKQLHVEAKKPYVSKSGTLVIPGAYLKEIAKDIDTSKQPLEILEEMTNKISSELGGKFSTRAINDAISGYGKIASPNVDDIQRRISVAKRVANLLSQIEDLETLGKSAKNRKQKYNVDKQIKDLIEKVRLWETQLEMTPEERQQLQEQKAQERHINARKKYLENYISDLQDRIDNEDFAPRKRVNKYEDTPEIEDLRTRSAHLRNEYKKAKYAHELENQTTVQKAKTFAYELIFGVTRGLAAGADMSALGVQGAMYSAANPKEAVKTFRKALDLSLTEEGYENYFAELQAHPLFEIARKAGLNLQLPNFYTSVQEEQQIGSLTTKFTNFIFGGIAGNVGKVLGKDYEKSKKYGEERLNPYVLGDRNYAIALSDIRMKLFEEFLNNQMIKTGLNVELDVDQVSRIANAVNTLTFATKLPAVQGKLMNDIVSAVFFSARKFFATWKLLIDWIPLSLGTIPEFDVKGVRLGSSKFQRDVNKQLLMDMYGSQFLPALGRLMLITGLPTAFAGLAYNPDDDDEENWVNELARTMYNPNYFNGKHSDFMKLKLGNTRVSVFQGIDGNIVFGIRQATGEYMTSSSREVRELNGQGFNKDRLQLGWEYISNKFAPTTSMAVNMLGGDRDKREAMDRFKGESWLPMWMTGFAEQYEKTDNLAGSLALGTLGLVGLSYNNYGGAEFAGAKDGTNNRAAQNVFDSSGLSAYNPGEGQREYFNGEKLTAVDGDAYKKEYIPQYSKFMTEATLSLKDKLDPNKHWEHKEGIVNNLKREAYKYAEMKISGVQAKGIGYATFSRDGNSFRLLKSQYGLKKQYVDEFMKRDGKNNRFIREIKSEVLQKLRSDKVKPTEEYLNMLTELAIYREANDYANDKLYDQYRRGKVKLVKKADYIESDDVFDTDELDYE